MPTAGTIRIKILGKDLFSKELTAATSRINQFGKKASKAGRAMTLGLSLPIAAMGVSALNTAGNFEAGMNRVSGLTGATTQQMSQLTEQARQLGATTQFSAKQAAEGMQFLSMAGFKTNDILGAMPATLTLAAAGALELGTAADIASNIMTGFSKKPEELAHVSDVLTKTFTSTNTTLEQLGEGMKFVAPISSAMGISLEETAAAMGLLGNAGIQASMAGTSLRGALSRLAVPTGEAIATLNKLGIKKTDLLDSAGNVKSLTDTVKLLENSGATAADMLSIFGQRAGPGMAALVGQGSDKLRALTVDVSNAGGIAKKIADKNMEGFNGAMKEMSSAAQELQIAIGDSGILKDFTNLIKALTDLLRYLSDTNPFILKLGTYFATLAAILGPVLWAFGKLSMLFGSIAGAFGQGGLLYGITQFISGLGLSIPVVGLFIAAIVSWGIAIKELVTNWDDLASTVTDFNLLGKTFKIMWGDAIKSVSEWFEGFMYMIEQFNRLILPKWLEKKLGYDTSGDGTGALRPEDVFSGLPAGVTNTNNAKVDVTVRAPAGTRVESEGNNVTTTAEIGVNPIGGGDN
jgi:TP901 family phage tail tape measure protein